MDLYRITSGLLLLLSLAAYATPFTPQADLPLPLQQALPLTEHMQKLTTLLAHTPQDDTRLELVRLYLRGARKPGFDAWFHHSEQLLHSVTAAGASSVSYHVLQADLQQQQHQFSQALHTLSRVFAAAPYHQQASLMAARIHLAQHHTALAQQACNRLWQQDLFLFSVCSYEVAGRGGDWAQSYIQLQKLWQRQTLTPELDIWLRGILAEQAEQLQLTAAAQQWLTPVLLQAPTSLWLKWADLSLELGEAQQVYQRLEEKQQQYPLSDGLLLRLALAERQLGDSAYYSTLLTERMDVRLARGDTDHAADLAHYFLRLKYDAKAALHWATINYQTAKEPDDMRLLTLSENAVKGTRE